MKTTIILDSLNELKNESNESPFVINIEKFKLIDKNDNIQCYYFYLTYTLTKLNGDSLTKHIDLMVPSNQKRV